MIFVSFSKAVIKQSTSTNIVAFVATVADHKTPDRDLQPFFDDIIRAKKKAPRCAGPCP
jgi:hypothetical protein